MSRKDVAAVLADTSACMAQLSREEGREEALMTAAVQAAINFERMRAEEHEALQRIGGAAAHADCACHAQLFEHCASRRPFNVICRTGTEPLVCGEAVPQDLVRTAHEAMAGGDPLEMGVAADQVERAVASSLFMAFTMQRALEEQCAYDPAE